MKILICGGRGQLGSDCTEVLSRVHDVTALGHREMDITSMESVEEVVRELRPDMVLNCAAYTKVDACETEKELAWSINVDGPRNLAVVSSDAGVKLIHISTDYVFNGLKRVPEPYLEDDAPDPISYYGKTKLESERMVRSLAEDHIIIRTAWVYGIKGSNFLKTMLRLALSNPGGVIKVVNDQYGSPTWSYRLAEQIARLIEVDARGTYHATSEGYCTWYEVAEFFLDRMGVEYNIVPCSTEEYPTPAKRPANSILENMRLKKEGINLMPHWKDDIGVFIERYKMSLINEMKGAIR
jgi:dTDP-4-dehydrorhamnose reductase